ncbi:hypothetical protein H5410_026444 [Solanum commersonii]|uniref:ABC-type xenobiotic transporter n=1 Tax=Solanum commersonii TaxID=4109 RepID=A0A9J5YYV5_SOLCO|nr:hypothetical protein H5410_026444 [Solanum commersonii]
MSVPVNKYSETEQPFLQKDEVNTFSSASIWSLITFRWLNPLFKKGHEEKLRVEHIPSIPHTETSNETSSLLEDALPHRIGVRVRAALMALIYKRTLSMKYGSTKDGKIVNFVNFDVERIGDFWLAYSWSLVTSCSGYICSSYLVKEFGCCSLCSCSFFDHIRDGEQHTACQNARKTPLKDNGSKDVRIKATSETLKSMRVLKLHSWESTFLKKLLQLRENERGWLKRYLYTCSAVAFLFWASPTLVSVVTFGVCIILETPLTSGTVLSALATFRILQEPIYNLPELISMVAQTKVSVDRIQDFMREEDQMKLTSYHTPDTSEVVIELEPGEYAWDTNESKKSTIKITEKIRIMKGWKVAICGSVGSGKSSLICSIMGEIPRISGSGIKLSGSKAFVPQSAWIQTGTVRDNVLFGKEMHKAHYDGVVDQCALKRDIEIAVYSDSDIYLLDDPFSAVDAQTGAHMFKAKCLIQHLHEKTVVYATHQLEFLDASDLILVVKDGRIAQSGKYSELIADPDGELLRHMVAHNKSLDQLKPSQKGSCLTKGKNQKNQIEDLTNENKILERTQQEDAVSGRVKWKVYSTFVTSAYKGALVLPVLLCQVLFQGLQMASNYWIAWGTEEEGRATSKRLIGIFKLYIGMMKSLFREPLSFFDSTPSSRILNRSSTDQSTMDTDIPYRLAGLAFALIQLSSIVVLMSNVAWQIMFLFLLILAISVWYQAYYITTARELVRMVGIQKAPILHHFSESLTGVATIRCFNQEDRFLNKNLSLIDNYSRVVFHNSATMEWLCLAGLAATYGLNLNVLQAWVIWNLCNVENKMISVERILQLSDVPSEAPLIIEKSGPKPDWLLKGRIDIKNLHVQYSPDLPRVLKGITCTFPEGKKIGVVGRTGSGKSTLIQSLFRVVESSEGCILIDGIDISKIGLQDLRSKLSIIPQDPTLFQGPIRTNLDPLQQHTDQDIWEVLHKCHLADIVKQDTRLLDAPARVLLQKRRILVLDEATASVDTETDSVIQKTIREETNGCTVITVAHRIPTVIDNGLVLVLGEGKILEFDTPNQLLKNSSSAFSNLVAEFLGRSSKENERLTQSAKINVALYGTESSADIKK